MANVLLTGGRAPVTLDLARAFHRAGHTVFMAESLRGHLSQPSAAIKANFVVPAPRQESEAFLSALQRIVEENQIELLIPAGEETFHIAKGLDRLPCRVFTEPLKKLKDFHNKWNFVISAGECDLRVPETMLIARQDDLLFAYSHWRGLVLKPVYSRFASPTLVLPALRDTLPTLKLDSPWIAQRFIPGQQFCTYSVCQNGRITAHAAYPAVFTAGQGAPIAFQAAEHPEIFKWVQTFVAHFNVTGQMAFDFVQSPEGEVYALECNPRAAGGLHLLTPHPRFVNSFFDSDMECITPDPAVSRMSGAAMLIHGLPSSIRHGRFGAWLKTFLHSDDVVLDYRDPLPFLLQFRSLFAYMRLGWRKGISAREASTWDIEWKGEG